jgi:amino acid transporter
VVALVLYFGVRISTRVQLVLALISILVVTVFFISVIVKLGSANSFRPFRPSSSVDGWAGIFFGVLYGILLFTGFETSANLAEETPRPWFGLAVLVIGFASTWVTRARRSAGS